MAQACIVQLLIQSKPQCQRHPPILHLKIRLYTTPQCAQGTMLILFRYHNTYKVRTHYFGSRAQYPIYVGTNKFGSYQFN